MTDLGPCIEWQGHRNARGYGREAWGRPRTDAKGRRRGRHMVLVHRLWVELVDGRPLAEGEIVMHLCDNPPCVRYDHLRRATQADNVHDAEAKGRGRRHHGEAHPNAKLTDADVAAIRKAAGSDRAIAARFGISRTRVRQLRPKRGKPA